MATTATMAARSLSIARIPPGCCLCDGLKEKLQAAFLLAGPDSLHDVDLQVRDITSNPEWEKAYQYEIPVLAKVLSDGTEIENSTWINSH
ncbi:Glutaredoxin-like protein [Corchorus capsularis]|uniref:Glutaredoxin-like protein n=1 Tax=Corchorus capsularis TaxID=210143 RepID=A0A1R3GXD5_COCAP|nr:Glutaredoxin-like protein [Corchorus capsularis]